MSTDLAGRDRRRGANALIAYGLVGIVLLGLLGVAVVYVAFRAADSQARLDAQRDRIVQLLDDTASALQTADQATSGVGTSLGASADALRSASDLARLVSDGANRLADQAGFSILGQQPFVGFTDDLQKIAGQTQALSQSLGQTAGSLTQNGTDVAALGAKLGVISEDVAGIRTSVADLSLDYASWVWLGALVALVILGWLAVPAVAALWLGRRWRRAPA
jgi:hypothetical protein